MPFSGVFSNGRPPVTRIALSLQRGLRYWDCASYTATNRRGKSRQTSFPRASGAQRNLLVCVSLDATDLRPVIDA